MGNNQSLGDIVSRIEKDDYTLTELNLESKDTIPLTIERNFGPEDAKTLAAALRKNTTVTNLFLNG